MSGSSEDLRHHALTNLRIVDGSDFPTSLGVNLRQSIYGLARLAASNASFMVTSASATTSKASFIVTSASCTAGQTATPTATPCPPRTSAGRSSA